ncbi:sensor histidine kinase [Pseudalkalibacillus hwajinpoensis]|uniref:sensor histidine kinase n=1 Tax=Guptibacillus hwajinpoensis TaxID=208199 RepID=UPI001CFD3CC2|nr:ATP-binding protein [Pseudalkalibacillus hwajinpoensis]
MRHSIERKILVPFLIIVLVPIFIIGAVSMWSSYQSEKQLKQATVQEHLTSLDRYAAKLDDRVKSGRMSEEEAKSLIKIMINETKGLYVEEADGTLSSEGKVVQASQLDWYNGEATNSLLTESVVLTEQIKQWNWTLYQPMSFSFYSGSLPDIQKYTLLISIFTGVIAVQFTIILSYHLSKPIKNLAAFCKRIALGERTKGIEMNDNRKDEIGVLSSSLKDMVETLDERNAQIDKIKKLNETILNSVHVGMVLVIEGANSVYNEAAQTMMKEDPLLQERLGKLTIHETKRRSEEIWDHKRKEEKVFYAVSYKVLGTSEKQRSIITFEDITHRRKLEQRVERMSRLASLGEMASGIAHEIRNPLAGIKTTTELLTRRLELTKDQLTLTENMLLDIDRVNKIITNILQFSRPMETNPSLLKVDDTLNSLVLLMKTIADEKNVILHHIENNTEIFVDRDHLRQILLNLILNGINAMPDGGELILSSFQRENDVTIMISDTGVGMEDAVMEKIFDPFYTTRAEGTGLGLSIVHQLVVQNNGEIDVNSIRGKGTEFSITFPTGREEK